MQANCMDLLSACTVHKRRTYDRQCEPRIWLLATLDLSWWCTLIRNGTIYFQHIFPSIRCHLCFISNSNGKTEKKCGKKEKQTRKYCVCWRENEIQAFFRALSDIKGGSHTRHGRNFYISKYCQIGCDSIENWRKEQKTNDTAQSSS